MSRAESLRKYLHLPLAFYGVCTLLSMATMSIGAAVLGIFAAFFTPQVQENMKRGLFGEAGLRHYYVSALCLIGAVAISLYFAPHLVGVEVNTGELGKTWYLIIPVLFAMVWVVLDEKQQRTVLRAWIITFGILSVVGVIQYFTGFPREQVIPNNEGRYHAVLLMGHHLSVGSTWIFPFFFAVVGCFSKAMRVKFGLPRWFFVVASVFGLLTLFFTYSRAVWVSVPIGLVTLALLAFGVKRALMAGVAIAVLGIAVLQNGEIQERVYSKMGHSERLYLWRTHLGIYKDFPVKGVGFRRSGELSFERLKSEKKKDWIFAGHAHNNLIEMMSSTGTLGALTWLIFCWIVFRMSSDRRFREQHYAVFLAVTSAWVVFHLNGMTQVNFWEGKVQHQMLWIISMVMAWRMSGNQSQTRAA